MRGDDLPALASRFGADLLSVLQEWLDMEKAVARLQKHGLRLPAVGGKLWEFDPGQRIMFWEVHSGCGNATRAFVESASGDHEIAGPLVDTVCKAWFGSPSWNVFLPMRTPVLVGDHGWVAAHVGTLCTSVHLLELLAHRNKQSPQSHGAHSLFIAIVPPPIATKNAGSVSSIPQLHPV